MPSVLLIGKGPSAVNAPNHLRAREPVATINDAGKLIDWDIDYCFFTDIEQIEAARDLDARTITYICPTILHRKCEPCEESLPSWMHWRDVRRYKYRTCNPDEFQRRVRHRAICHRSTATAAMSWLAYEGFDHLRLIGFDGGTAYANGVNPGLPHGFNCDVFREAQLRLAEVLKDEMGVTTEWLT